jgi:hypothetical protein
MNAVFLPITAISGKIKQFVPYIKYSSISGTYEILKTLRISSQTLEKCHKLLLLQNLISINVKLYPLYAMEAQGGRGDIAPTHT